MSIHLWLMILIGPYLVVGAVAAIADPRAAVEFLLRALSPPRRPVTRPRSARMAVA